MGVHTLWSLENGHLTEGQCPRVPVKGLSFVIDVSILSFDSLGFLTSKQK